MNKANNYYNKNLRSFSHELRNNFTKAEACLWKYVLKARMMRGYSFKRQRPVLKYIADFMCMDLKLIIDVNGFTHHDAEQIRFDKQRQKDLENHGYHILHFSDDEILNHIWAVDREISAWVIELEKRMRMHYLTPVVTKQAPTAKDKSA